jgi:uncharacterized protein involved in exopolysaccharide biosynthesis
MLRHVETAFRHWRLLVVALLLPPLVSLGYSVAQPARYQSTARLWFSGGPPADQQVLQLRELLKTQPFAQRVLDAAGIKLSSNLTNGVPGLRTLLTLANGGVDPNDPREYMRQNVSVTLDSQQAATITAKATRPGVAAATVRAIYVQYSAAQKALWKARDDSDVRLLTQAVESSAADYKAAQQAVDDYITDHPALKASGRSDANLTVLVTRTDGSRQAYLDLLSRLQQAQLKEATDQASSTGFTVIDPESPATAPVNISRTLLFAGAAGLTAGLMLAALIMVLLTVRDTSIRTLAEVRELTGLTAVGSIRRIGQAG